MLQGGRDGGLSRGREPGEPDGAALLLAQFVAFLALEPRVPIDVAVADIISFVRSALGAEICSGVMNRTHVAMLEGTS